jgi:DNA-binding NarL/FixJ family response regulator
MPAPILIVEDQEVVRRSLRDLLQVRFSQYPVLEAASAEQAFDLILTEPPRLVIMDISLPGMNGIEATRMLHSSFPSTPILIFTIHEDSIYRKEAEAAGASAFVPKRALQNDLLPQLSSLLAEVNEQQSG